MGWFSQLASVISGESPANYNARQDARDALDKHDRERRAAENNARNEQKRIEENK